MIVRPFRFARLSALGIPHGVTKRDPSLPAFGSVSGNATISIVLANRRAWWERLGVPLEHTVFARQVHGTRVTVVTASERGRGALEPGTGIPESDALVTTERNLPLAMICADCVPVLLYAPDVPAIGVVHAGWRGTVAGITRQAVHILCTLCSARPERLWAFLGPSIGPCCYEVGEEVITAWLATEPSNGHQAVLSRNGRAIFDLWRANELLLVEGGVDPAHIERAGICTRCHAGEWFSYRANGSRAGAQAAVIALP
ncbi:peptidoglycan editing factor PgeF [Thermomicrobium sp.]|uniref:peptidoglycan editing factor PgeF n=1 Tax=Thermomicrobium sp. TaxID=1969469 RepID=UPI001B2B8564|nr:peptidoglycan editing factor PgeF [Thermomicrobium sp.]MBO9305956.1 peptidoglycan editing factor PgeF [Thermomicrobium sp.]